MRRVLLTAGVAAVSLLAAGCASSATGASNSGSAPVVLRLGFLANITHEPALVGLANGFFPKNLGQIDGGWEPEPYATEMVLDGGTRLVNEASLWPGGKFVTTNLVVTQSFLKAHASTVNGLLKGQIEANSYINSNASAAASSANDEL